MKSTKNSGFTLMELLLVIIIMGIAASFAFLSISNIGCLFPFWANKHFFPNANRLKILFPIICPILFHH